MASWGGATQNNCNTVQAILVTPLGGYIHCTWRAYTYVVLNKDIFLFQVAVDLLEMSSNILYTYITKAIAILLPNMFYMHDDTTVMLLSNMSYNDTSNNVYDVLFSHSQEFVKSHR